MTKLQGVELIARSGGQKYLRKQQIPWKLDMLAKKLRRNKTTRSLQFTLYICNRWPVRLITISTEAPQVLLQIYHLKLQNKLKRGTIKKLKVNEQPGLFGFVKWNVPGTITRND